MLPKEAALIGRWTSGLRLGEGSVCLNVGSSTRTFREQVQPFIAADILQPLARAGCRIVHCDMKEDDGVDEVGDLLDPAFQQRLIAYAPDLIICSNLLEHLTDPASFATACGLLAKPGGHCLFTVPRSYPYHPDPLDTMYRPTPSAVAALLPGWHVVAAEEIAAGSYLDEIRAGPAPAVALGRHVMRTLMPFYRPRRWWPAAHHLLWLFRSYRVSLVLLQKPAAEDGTAAADRQGRVLLPTS